ncbi:Uncharacterised protein [Paucimonas lemoignei]|nr:Uncharacterised protein [Paucimonas lemoignei]
MNDGVPDIPLSAGAKYAAATPSGTRSAETYDSCMARVLKITDPKLRLSSMSLCDGVK